MPYSQVTGFNYLPLAVALMAASLPLSYVQAATPRTNAASSQRLSFNIAAQSLTDALDQFAQQSGYQVLYDAAQANGLRSAELHGEHTPQQALAILTGGTHARYSQPNASSFVIDIPASASDTLQLAPVSISGKAVIAGIGATDFSKNSGRSE